MDIEQKELLKEALLLELSLLQESLSPEDIYLRLEEIMEE